MVVVWILQFLTHHFDSHQGSDDSVLFPSRISSVTELYTVKIISRLPYEARNLKLFCAYSFTQRTPSQQMGGTGSHPTRWTRSKPITATFPRLAHCNVACSAPISYFLCCDPTPAISPGSCGVEFCRIRGTTWVTPINVTAPGSDVAGPHVLNQSDCRSR